MAEQPKVRDEWGVTVSTTGHLLQRDRVAYPETAYTNGIQGAVTVEATLDRDGSVADTRVLNGPPELRKAALESVLQWRFANTAAGETQQIRIAFQHAEAQAQHTQLAQLLAAERELESSKKALEEQTGQSQQTGQEQTRQVLETQLANLGREMADYRKRFLEGDPTASERYQETRNPWDAPMLLFSLGVQRGETENLLCVGSRLARIDIDGFPESAKPELIAKLPVRVGETLSAASIEHAVAKMNGLDPKIVFRLQRLTGGEAVLRIVPWGTELDQRK
jgi:TonB family protein